MSTTNTTALSETTATTTTCSSAAATTMAAAKEATTAAVAAACSFCGATPVIDETCPSTCGSLEGFNEQEYDNPQRHSRMFGFDWSKGFVAPFLGVDIESAHAALKNNLSPLDSLIDLGCGDGRICIAACQLGAKYAVGCDLDEKLIQQAKIQAQNCGLEDKVSFLVKDLFQVDLLPYTVVTVFLLPETLSNKAFVKQFQNVIVRGGRVISFGWRIPLLGKPFCQNDDSNTTPSTSTDGYSGLVKQWYVYR